VGIDNLTLGEIKQIVSMFGSSPQSAAPHSMVGKFCIARCYEAGVHAGEVVSVDRDCVILKDSVRLWSWKAQDGIALSGVAQHGIDRSSSKLDVVNPVIYLVGVCELIPCSQRAAESINAAG
jgi:hypothetical protein